MDTREELRDELIAILGAARELSPDADRHLADVFVERLEQHPGARPTRKRRSSRRPFDGVRGPRRTVAALVMAGLSLVVGVPVSVHLVHPTASAQTVCTRDTYYPVLYHSRAAFRHALQVSEQHNDHLAMAREIHDPNYAYSYYVFWDHANCSTHS